MVTNRFDFGGGSSKLSNWTKRRWSKMSDVAAGGHGKVRKFATFVTKRNNRRWANINDVLGINSQTGHHNAGSYRTRSTKLWR